MGTQPECGRANHTAYSRRALVAGVKTEALRFAPAYEIPANSPLGKPFLAVLKFEA